MVPETSNLSENYRYRPRPETILAEIDKLVGANSAAR
jgi:hypothetical protein